MQIQSIIKKLRDEINYLKINANYILIIKLKAANFLISNSFVPAGKNNNGGNGSTKLGKISRTFYNSKYDGDNADISKKACCSCGVGGAGPPGPPGPDGANGLLFASL